MFLRCLHLAGVLSLVLSLASANEEMITSVPCPPVFIFFLKKMRLSCSITHGITLFMELIYVPVWSWSIRADYPGVTRVRHTIVNI